MKTYTFSIFYRNELIDEIKVKAKTKEEAEAMVTDEIEGYLGVELEAVRDENRPRCYCMEWK